MLLARICYEVDISNKLFAIQYLNIWQWWTQARYPNPSQRVPQKILKKSNSLYYIQLSYCYMWAPPHNLGEMYLDYPSALEMTGLDLLSARRVKKCLNFSLKCLKHERNQKLFPLNPNAGMFNVRNSEVFTVNFAGSSTYRDCAIPFCQRLLNNHFPDKNSYMPVMIKL